MLWHKLLAREGVDVATISGVDRVFIDAIKKFTKSGKELFFTYLNGKNFTHYIKIDQQELGRALYKEYFNSPASLKKYYKDGKLLLKDIMAETCSWQKKCAGDSRLLLPAFKVFWRQFKKINYIYSIVSWLGIEAWQNDFEKILHRLIEKNNLTKDQESIIFSAYQPWKKTAIQKLQNDIAQGVDAAKLAKKYQFLRSWAVVWYRPINEVWINNYKSPKIKEDKLKLYSISTLIRMLKPAKVEERQLRLAPFMVFFKDWRDDLRRQHAYQWSFLFEMIAHQFKTDTFDTGYLTLEEINGLLRSGLFPTELVKKRKEKPCVIAEDKDSAKIVVHKQVAKKYKAIVDEVAKIVEPNIVTGLCAEVGIVSGKVIIVRSYHDVKKVTGEHILVANTTHTNYLPAMQKARAFVTNEGGIICHAAIVAREMKKPCIVGTKIATQILKDGDMVEVDAEKGIVKKVGSILS